MTERSAVEAVPALVAEQKARLTEFMTATVDPRGDLEPWETLPLMQEQWERQRALLKSRVDEAHNRYQRVLDGVARASTPQAADFWYLVVFAAPLLAKRARRRTSRRP